MRSEQVIVRFDNLTLVIISFYMDGLYLYPIFRPFICLVLLICFI